MGLSLDFNVDAYIIIIYSQCSLEFVFLTPMPEKTDPVYLAFPWKILLKMLLHLSHMVGPCCKLFS